MYATRNTVVSILLMIPMPKMCPSHVVKDPTMVQKLQITICDIPVHKQRLVRSRMAAIKVIEYWWKRCGGDRTRPCVLPLGNRPLSKLMVELVPALQASPSICRGLPTLSNPSNSMSSEWNSSGKNQANARLCCGEMKISAANRIEAGLCARIRRPQN
jgi:hypothetical protein